MDTQKPRSPSVGLKQSSFGGKKHHKTIISNENSEKKSLDDKNFS